jgi:hypothetical protein
MQCGVLLLLLLLLGLTCSDARLGSTTYALPV